MELNPSQLPDNMVHVPEFGWQDVAFMKLYVVSQTDAVLHHGSFVSKAHYLVMAMDLT
jgi:hypothetical protein